MDGFVQRADFGGTGLEMKAIRKRPHHRLQHIAVALVRATLSLRLKFPVELKNGSVRQSLVVVLEHIVQDRQNPRLPINQSAVAIKADGGETREIHRQDAGTIRGS